MAVWHSVCAGCLLLFSSCSVLAQDATSTAAAAGPAPAVVEYDKEPLPADPVAALEMVRKANGLGWDSLKPWYLKAHY